MKQRIFLNGLEFHAFHGWYEEEQKNGGLFRVDVSYEINATQAAQSDHLSHTVDYTQVYDCVKKEMSIPSKLIEHLAQRIVMGLEEHFSSAKNWKVKISKLNPPIDGQVESFSVLVKSKKIGK